MRRSRVLRVLMVAACFTLAACGSGGGSGSNDNGTAFRFSGMFQETQEQVATAADRLPDADTHVGDSGTTIVLGVTTTVPFDHNGDGDLDGGFIGLANNLDQNVNVQEIHVQIFIAGAKLNNPVVTDVVPMAISMPAATVDDNGVRTPSQSFTQTVFVRPDVLAFLARNQTLLPPLPFDMSVVMSVTAIGDSGDTFDTNTITYPVTVVAAPAQ